MIEGCERVTCVKCNGYITHDEKKNDYICDDCGLEQYAYKKSETIKLLKEIGFSENFIYKEQNFFQKIFNDKEIVKVTYIYGNTINITYNEEKHQFYIENDNSYFTLSNLSELKLVRKFITDLINENLREIKLKRILEEDE